MSNGTFSAIWAIVRQIPPGQAATYGQIARWIGRPRAARLVGYALAACRDDQTPCHRVVDRLGGTKPCFDRLAPDAQRLLLSAEGVPFTPDGRVDLSLCQWAGPV